MNRLFIVGLFLFTVSLWAQPYAIGHRDISYVDSARGARSIPTDVYYPATIAGDNTPVAAAPAGGFPVISFGHGFLLPVSAYQYLWQSLVPEGYIVALPRTEGNFSPQHLQLGYDLAFLIRRLQLEGVTPASPFFGAIGSTSCVMGHSMGGGASFLAAQSAAEITALANFAAAETTPSAIGAAEEIAIPALVFAASDDCVTPPAAHQIPMYSALASDCKTYVNITGGSHCKFGENNFTCNLGELTCTGSISRATQHQLVLFHLLPFLNYYLKGSAPENCLFQERLAAGNGITYTRACALPAPQNLSISTNGTMVTLRWMPVAGACGYELLRGTEAGFDYDISRRIYDGTATNYTETPPVEQAVYQVWAK